MPIGLTLPFLVSLTLTDVAAAATLLEAQRADVVLLGRAGWSATPEAKTTATRAEFEALDSAHGVLGAVTSADDPPVVVRCGGKLILRPFKRTTGAAISFSSLLVKTIEVRVDDTTLPIELSEDEADELSFTVRLDETDNRFKQLGTKVCAAPHRVAISAQLKNSSSIGNPITWRGYQPFDPYSPAAIGRVGVWLPFGLLGVRYVPGVGLELSALPVGVALGTRISLADSGQFLGISAALFYSATAGTVTAVDGTKTAGTIVSYLSPGLLFDWNGWVGLLLGWSFGLDGKTPSGLNLGISVAPGFPVSRK